MKNQAQHLLLGTIATLLPTASSILFEDFNLKPKPDLAPELAYLTQNEWSVATLAGAPPDCSSPLIEWSTAKIHEMGYSTYKELFENQILQMPYIYKHYIDKNEEGESFGFGLDEHQTKELIARHEHTMDFWTMADVDNSIQTDDILLLSMHGSDLLDNEKLIPTITRMFDFATIEDVLNFATVVQDKIRSLPDGANNPLLTMNAVATKAATKRGISEEQDSIIVGDGVLQFLADSNLSSSGPDFVHAHEFSHHIQFEMDMAVPPNAGFENDIRRKEMMADAIAAYFLAHDHGGNMVKEEIEEFTMASFSTGDCSLDNDDHHGTPIQRKCAAIWGASQAAENLGAVDPEMFARRFDEVYLRILALDGEDCTLVLEDATLDAVADVDQEEVGHQEEWETFEIPGASAPEAQNTFEFSDNSSVEVINRPNTNSDLDFSGLQTQSDEEVDVEVEEQQGQEIQTVDIPQYQDPLQEGLTGYESQHQDEQQQDPETSSTVPQGRNGGISDTYMRNRGSSNQSGGYFSESESTSDGDSDGINPPVVKTIGPPDQTRSYNMVSGVAGFDSRDCNLPWVYCSPEMEELAKNNGPSTKSSSLVLLSLVAFGGVLFL